MSRARLLLGALLLGGCATVPAPPPAARDAVTDFTVEARFALRLTPDNAAPQSAGGRLTWEHQQGRNRILIASPLGVGLAEIETTPTLSRLHTADGREHSSPDPDALMEEATGQRLPVNRFPAWLLARPTPSADTTRDAQGRPQRVTEDAWRITYEYDQPTPDALPSRLTLTRDRDIELRLRIEDWKTTP